MKKLLSMFMLAVAFTVSTIAPVTAAVFKPGLPVDSTNPYPVTSSGYQETFQLATTNVAAAPQQVYGGTYIFGQLCATYGTAALQVLGPDNVTYETVTSKTTADASGGTTVSLGSGATVKATLTSTTGCNIQLSRVPS